MQSNQVKYISLFSNSIRKSTDFPSRKSYPLHKSAVFLHFHLHLQLQKPIVLAWKKKKPSGSVRSTKMMLQSAYFIASTLKILPEPLDFILREFGGGNGGGGDGFSFGSGDFDGWRRRRSRKKVNWGFGVVFFVVLGVGLWLILWKRLEIDVFWGVLGLTLFGFSVNVWKRGVLDWALGFCCCAALVGLLLKDDLQKWVSFIGTVKIERRRRRKRRLF